MPRSHQDILEERALNIFTAALGQPEVTQVGSRWQYYWPVPRYRRPTLSVYLTLEPTDPATPMRIMIGDLCQIGEHAISTVVLCREDQVNAVLEDIRGRMVC